MSAMHTSPIRAARIERGLTQETLSDLVGVTKSAVSKWEAGATMPRPAQVKALAAALNMSPSAIYDAYLEAA